MEQKDYSSFYVDQSPDWFSGLLLTFGWADLLKAITYGEVKIIARGSAYEVVLENPLDEFAWQNTAGLGGFLYYIEKKPSAGDKEAEAEDIGGAQGEQASPTKKAKAKNLPEPRPEFITNFIDYDRERAKKAEAIKQRMAHPTFFKRGTAPDDSNFTPITYHKELPLAELVVQMKGPITTYNQIVSRWMADKNYWRNYVELLVEYFSTTPNNLTRLEESWNKLAKENNITGSARVTSVQIFTPTAGKGGNASKANGLSVGQKDNFWLLEMLKIWGMQVAGLPMTIKGSEDRKTYVAVPAYLDLQSHTKIWSEFKKIMFPGGPVKMDVQVSLRYTRTFVEQWLAGQVQFFEPASFIRGLMVAHYKDLGSAKALINLSQINLPNWMKLADAFQAQQYLDILNEHEKVIAFLDDKRGDEYQLLQLYREFLSGHTLQPFFDFAGGYATTLMKRLESGQPATQFTTNNLEVLIMAYAKDDQPDIDLTEITRNSGFRNIATAIRLSTIVPQRQKAKGDRPLYEVRYGLGEELRRKAGYRDDFIDALNDFIQSYNQETSQKFERTQQQRRKLVTVNDLDEFMALLKNDRYSRIVGGLLVTYGYARDPFDAHNKDEKDEI